MIDDGSYDLYFYAGDKVKLRVDYSRYHILSTNYSDIKSFCKPTSAFVFFSSVVIFTLIYFVFNFIIELPVFIDKLEIYGSAGEVIDYKSVPNVLSLCVLLPWMAASFWILPLAECIAKRVSYEWFCKLFNTTKYNIIKIIKNVESGKYENEIAIQKIFQAFALKKFYLARKE